MIEVYLTEAYFDKLPYRIAQPGTHSAGRATPRRPGAGRPCRRAGARGARAAAGRRAAAAAGRPRAAAAGGAAPGHGPGHAGPDDAAGIGRHRSCCGSADRDGYRDRALPGPGPGSDRRRQCHRAAGARRCAGHPAHRARLQLDPADPGALVVANGGPLCRVAIMAAWNPLPRACSSASPGSSPCWRPSSSPVEFASGSQPGLGASPANVAGYSAAHSTAHKAFVVLVVAAALPVAAYMTAVYRAPSQST